MIKEDNLGDTNKLQHLMKMDSFHLENCKMGWKARSFYRINNKEQERNRKYMINQGHLVWGEKEQEISTEPRADWAFGDWLTGYTAFPVVALGRGLPCPGPVASEFAETE